MSDVPSVVHDVCNRSLHGLQAPGLALRVGWNALSAAQSACKKLNQKHRIISPPRQEQGEREPARLAVQVA